MELKNTTCTGITDLPIEILLYIFSLIPPYACLRNCKLVCKAWARLINDIFQMRNGRFVNSMMEGKLVWREFIEETRVSSRYSHSICYYKDAVYLFGGHFLPQCQPFHDLWKFDLSTRQWIPTAATGIRPPPKALATLLPYKDELLLFGGLPVRRLADTRELTPYTTEIYFYNELSNNWRQLDTLNPPVKFTNHTATLHGHILIVIGSSRLRKYSNTVWVLDLKSLSWWKPATTSPVPAPRCGQTQIYMDDNNLLVIGGCTLEEKNNSDVWLLSFNSGERDELWRWTKIAVRDAEVTDVDMWNSTGCRVDNYVVFFGECFDLQRMLLLGSFNCRLKRRIYLLDISKVMDNKEACWTAVDLSNSPPFTKLSKVVFSGAEIIVVGGMRVNSFAATCALERFRPSNSVHIMTWKSFIH